MDIINELSDTALIVQGLADDISLIAAVGENYLQTRVKKSLLAESAEKSIVIINGSLGKDLGVCLEYYLSTRLIGIADDLHLFGILTAFKALEVDMLAVVNGKLEVFRECVNNRRANAVQTACHLISAAAAELTACVEYSINNGSRGDALLGVYTRRDTASVINYPYNVIGEYIDDYLGAVTLWMNSELKLKNFTKKKTTLL